jgi:DNA-binding CsgD family transcriptional regulator
MKIPQVVTRHKIRDTKICSLWAQENLTCEEIGTRFGISRERVRQILYANRALLIADKTYEKARRLFHLNRLLNKHPESLGTKGTLDIIAEIRKELEGEKTTEVNVGLQVNNKVGSNGTFTGEDRILQERLRKELFGDKT